MAVRKEGSFIEVVLPNGKYSYGRILPKADYAFYNIYVDNQITDIKKISQEKVLFIVAVYKDSVTKGRWRKIGHLDLDSRSKVLPLKFIEDTLNPGAYEIYDPNTGEITPSSKDKCIGLERSAVWEPAHVEARIVDYFEGRSNKWVEQLSLK
ncbi:MAG TPA: immunity 26/phosphotriesterase HocA family protein [Mucilaginibacter sp.]|jgi:hypothetical protein